MKRISLLFTILISSFFLNATIVYTDINPDGTPPGIDFNQDGTNEFNIGAGNANGDFITYSANSNNNVYAIGTLNTQNWDVPNCVNNGFAIGANGNWEGQGDCAVNGWGDPNPTITVGQDEYLAVRIDLATGTHYGWIRISVDANGNVTYKDYAYNDTPNAPINAGATEGGGGEEPAPEEGGKKVVFEEITGTW